mgnify:CR=1 FL=1
MMSTEQPSPPKQGAFAPLGARLIRHHCGRSCGAVRGNVSAISPASFYMNKKSLASSWRSQIEASRTVGNLDAQLVRADRSLIWVRISSWAVEDGPGGVHQVQSIIEETEEFVLRRLDVPYRLGVQGEIIVEMDSLSTPFVYGQGTDHLPEEELDWSAWLGQWCLQEE